jgi:hypothetical protein
MFLAWTCEIKDKEALKNRLISFLEKDQHKQETLNSLEKFL